MIATVTDPVTAWEATQYVTGVLIVVFIVGGLIAAFESWIDNRYPGRGR